MNRLPPPKRAAAFCIFAFLSLTLLFDGLLSGNDHVTLPWALQFVDASWLPNDWFLNSPIGNQLLAATGIGWLIKQLGFLHAAIVSRLVAYGLLALSLTILIRKLRVPVGYTIVALWLFVKFGQSIAAGEWIFGPAESKVFAYACIFWGLSFFVEKRLVPAYACFGLATSFHILVGGYALSAALMVALYDGISFRTLMVPLAGYALFAAVGIHNAASEILQSWGGPDVSYIIAYFRHPHHMVPAKWRGDWWWRLIMLSAAWINAYWYALRLGPRRLLLFGAATMIPFAGGLLVAPFDASGTFLKYYPFRVGDTLFPFIIILCGYFVIKRWANGRAIAIALRLALTIITVETGHGFAKGVQSYVRTDSEQGWVEACTWLREMTPKDVVVMTPPNKPSFVLLAQRATVVQFKFFPFTQSEVLGWYHRLHDLAGGKPPSNTGRSAGAELNESYFSLLVGDLIWLAKKYGAQYVLTKCDENHNIAPVFSNGTYCVYKPEVHGAV